MPDEIEEKHSENVDISYIFGIVRRRHLYFLIPLFVVWVLVWGASWVLPPRYKASTLILVQQPTMPENLVASNISDDIQTRLSSIQQQVLSRTRLLVIIDKLNLYGAAHDPAKADQAVDQMRKDIPPIELVHDEQGNSVSAFKISFTSRDPHLAQEVAGELSDLFISETSRARLDASQNTTSFLEKQLADASANLAEQEAKVKQFEAAHEGDLPAQQSSNLEILGGAQSQLQNEQQGLDAARQQRVYLQNMIEQEKTAQVRAATTGTGTPGAGSSELASVNQQLSILRAQLADLSSRYTDKYPDVLSKKAEIARTEAIRENLIAQARKSADPGVDPNSSPALRQLQSELQANQVEINNREATIAQLKNSIGGYQGRLNAEPGTEEELADLNRGYTQSQANYNDLLKKRDDSEMATNMEQQQQGERFTLLDPPSLPTKPDFPNRLKFCAAGLGAGFALGLLIAGVFEFLDDRLHREKDIKSLLPIAVISEVPAIVTPQDEQASKRKLRLGWALTAAIVVVIAAGSLLSYKYQ